MRMRYLTTILPHFTVPLSVATHPLPDAKAAVEEMVSDINSSEIAFFMLNFLVFEIFKCVPREKPEGCMVEYSHTAMNHPKLLNIQVLSPMKLLR